MIDKTGNTPNTSPLKKQTAPTGSAPAKAAAVAAPAVPADKVNVLTDPSTYLSTLGTAGDFVRDAAKAAEIVADASRAARPAGILARAVSIFSKVGSKLNTVINAVATTAPKFFKVLGKAAPVLNVAVAGIDIGRAVAEKDPVKKQKAMGYAGLSVVSTALYLGSFAFPPLALVGLAVTAVQVGDDWFNKGKISSLLGGL
jgi:hypothetical protein